MSDFNKTRRGTDFYDKHIPQLIHVLERIALQLEESNKLEERKIKLDEKLKIAQLIELNQNREERR